MTITGHFIMNNYVSGYSLGKPDIAINKIEIALHNNVKEFLHLWHVISLPIIALGRQSVFINMDLDLIESENNFISLEAVCECVSLQRERERESVCVFVCVCVLSGDFWRNTWTFKKIKVTSFHL